MFYMHYYIDMIIHGTDVDAPVGSTDKNESAKMQIYSVQYHSKWNRADVNNQPSNHQHLPAKQLTVMERWTV